MKSSYGIGWKHLLSSDNVTDDKIGFIVIYYVYDTTNMYVIVSISNNKT